MQKIFVNPHLKHEYKSKYPSEPILTQHIRKAIEDYEPVTGVKVKSFEEIGELLEKSKIKKDDVGYKSPLATETLKDKVRFVPYIGFQTSISQTHIAITFRDFSEDLIVCITYSMALDIQKKLEFYVDVCEKINDTTFKTLSEINERVALVEKLAKEKLDADLDKVNERMIELLGDIKKHVAGRENPSESQKTEDLK